MVGFGVLNGMLGPIHPIYLCKLCLHRSGVLRHSPINARSCLNHAWLRQALKVLFHFIFISTGLLNSKSPHDQGSRLLTVGGALCALIWPSQDWARTMRKCCMCPYVTSAILAIHIPLMPSSSFEISWP